MTVEPPMARATEFAGDAAVSAIARLVRRSAKRGAQASLGDQIVSAVVPAQRSPSAATELPVVRLSPGGRRSSTYYVVTAMDGRGRLADRSPIRLLQWPQGHRFTVTILKDVVVMLSDRFGAHRITRQGHVQLPLAVRRSLGLSAGDRLFVAAYPEHDLLVVYPMATVDHIVGAYHTSITEETRA